ncbi:MAG: phage holin family protein [Armatimonadetes bacterium]|nr:phage holin family protein [Armatimonadota bacterium]
MNLIIRWIVHAVILWIVVGIGMALGLGVKLDGWVSAFVVVFLLALANAIVRPVVQLFLWPLNCLTFGLFGFLISVLLILFLNWVVPGFHAGGFVGAVYLAVGLSVLGGLANSVLKFSRED